ncbi:hypothetical protein UM93_10155 [Psychromicrobium lacuslunae]|uniref:Uncharacterized protein n=1 Tax=Psychromicrobium lacuslunae TaxID=1618207 RepID=A0A0D4C0A1_9MICC|nr:hypothetical protein UM93_10155 [Psychromicrobium lacuslunae]
MALLDKEINDSKPISRGAPAELVRMGREIGAISRGAPAELVRMGREIGAISRGAPAELVRMGREIGAIPTSSHDSYLTAGPSEAWGHPEGP